MANATVMLPIGGNNPPQFSFRDAAESYVTHGGEDRYLGRVTDYFDDTGIRDIHPFDVRLMAETLYPDATGATRNRCAVTPARAVLLHAYDRGWRELIRVRRFREDRPARREPASITWMFAFLRQCDRDGLGHLAALVLFMAQTGARISEAIRLEWTDVDLSARTAVLCRTKTDVNSVRHLSDELAERMRDLDRDPALPVFKYRSRHSVSERIGAVCFRAEIPYKSPHVCGRHTFATTAMDMGADIRDAMEAGGWRSSKVFMETYVHPRKSSGRQIADRFNGRQIMCV